MQEPMFNDMSPEDLLSWIENANKVLDQKVAAETAEIEERQQRLVRLIARRDGKDEKAKAKPVTQKPRGRPPQASGPKPSAQPQEPAVAAE